METVEDAPYNYEPEGRTFESCRAHHNSNTSRCSALRRPTSLIGTHRDALRRLLIRLLIQLAKPGRDQGALIGKPTP